jgi:gluconokinase
MILVVAGVSGSGKTTVGRLLASRLGAEFLDGDDLHSAANIAKMKSGAPLDDADRAPWLRAIGERIDAWLKQDRFGVLTCSALKRAYRDELRQGRNGVWIVLLEASESEIARRLEARQGHFMPKSLLASQFAALEPLAPDESHAFSVDASQRPEAIVEDIAASLEAPPGGG